MIVGITTRQVKNLVEDVRKEVDRRHAGRSSLSETIFICILLPLTKKYCTLKFA